MYLRTLPHTRCLVPLLAAAYLHACVSLRSASLKEGWYSYSVEGSIWSPQPQLDSLMSVSGMDTYGNEQALYRTIAADGSVGEALSLLGGFKGSGWLLPQYNASRVGLQRGGSWMEYFEGPTEPVTVSAHAFAHAQQPHGWLVRMRHHLA